MIPENFPYAAFRDVERAWLDALIQRVAAAYQSCGQWAHDRVDYEEELVDDIFDILKPSEDEELLTLRVVDAYLEVVLN